jgi:hypothetical protein
MATKITITPRDVLRSHLQAGVAARRRRLAQRAALRPIRTVCAWCAGYNKPTAVLVDVPIDHRGLSHGICQSCRATLRADAWVARASSDAAAG